MSIKYNIACRKCRKTLWTAKSGVAYQGLYSEPEHVDELGTFLFAHRGHPLLFDVDSTFWDDYEDVTKYEDDSVRPEHTEDKSNDST